MRHVVAMSLLLAACAHGKPSPRPYVAPVVAVTIHLDPAQFDPAGTVRIDVIIASGYGCSKHYNLALDPAPPPAPPPPEPVLSPSPAPCPPPPPDEVVTFTEPVAGRTEITVTTGALHIGNSFRLDVSGPARTGCDQVRGYATATAMADHVDAPPLALVTIPTTCPG